MLRIIFVLVQGFMFVAVITSSQAEPLRITIMPEFFNNADLKQLECLSVAIYFEGRNQSVTGMAAIGHVILNRTVSSKFPDSICEVVWSPYAFSWTHDGKSDKPPVSASQIETIAWNNAIMVAKMILVDNVPDITNGSDHYHAAWMNKYPAWTKKMKRQLQIGDHIFYKS
jgi:spore germination cell wall hydrolase CwlJ-like protein